MGTTLITTTAAGKILGVSGRRVLAMIADGRLRGERVGNYWLVKEEEARKLAKLKREPGRPKKAK